MSKPAPILLLAMVACILCACNRRADSPPSTHIQTVKIGALLPLSGDAAPYGQNTKEGIDLGVERANEVLTNTGLRLEVIYEDSRANARDGASGAQKLVTIDRVQAIIDNSVSDVALAALPICDRNQVVLLSTGSTSPKLSGASRFFFRLWNSDLEEGRFSADYVADRIKPETTAVLFIHNEYGEGLRNVFVAQLEARGVTVGLQESFDVGSTDIRAQLLKLRNSNPAVVYLVAYPQEARDVLKQARELGVETIWIGTVVMLEETISSLLKELKYVMHFPSPALPIETSAPLKEFRSRFQSRYGRPPPVLADVGYDAATLLAEALSHGRKTGTDLAAELVAIRNREMASGLISFDLHGDVHKPMQMKTIASP